MGYGIHLQNVFNNLSVASAKEAKLRLIIILALIHNLALAEPKGEFTAGAGESFSAVRSVYDGDSFNLAFRLNDIDTPEIKGKFESEKQLAIKARDFLSKVKS